MPLVGTGDILGDAIKAAVDVVSAEVVAGTLNPTDPAMRTAIFRAFGNAIVNHLTGPAGVGAVLSVSGVTVGGGVSGPGSLG